MNTKQRTEKREQRTEDRELRRKEAGRRDGHNYEVQNITSLPAPPPPPTSSTFIPSHKHLCLLSTAHHANVLYCPWSLMTRWPPPITEPVKTGRHQYTICTTQSSRPSTLGAQGTDIMFANRDGGGGEGREGGWWRQGRGSGGWRNLNFFVEFVPSVPSYSFNTNCSAASPDQIHVALRSVLRLRSAGAQHQQPHAELMGGTQAALAVTSTSSTSGN